MSSLKVIVVLLAAVPCLASVKKNHEVDEVEALAEVYPEFRRGLLKYAHHFQPHEKTALLASRPGTSLLKHAHNVHHRHHRHHRMHQEPPALRNAAVEQALSADLDGLASLKASRGDATRTRSELEGSVTEMHQHMNDAKTLKTAMQKKEMKLRIEEEKLKTLENDEARVGETQGQLVSSLHRMIGPKLMLARERFEKREMIQRKEEHAAAAWREKSVTLKEEAMALIKQKKSSYEMLLQAEAEVAQSKRKEELARIQYEKDRTKTAEQVQSYRYAETRYKAELEHERKAKENTEAARETMMKLNSIESTESDKVDQSISVRKAKLRKKINKVEALREKDSHALSDLEQQYKDWQENQRQRTAKVAQKKEETERASETYGARHEQVLDKARKKVVREAQGDDWGDWGSMSGMFGGSAGRDEDDA